MAATPIALGVSTFYIILTSLIAYWLRKYVSFYVKQPLIKSLFLEAIATAELCGGCFELIIRCPCWGLLESMQPVLHANAILMTVAYFLVSSSVAISHNFADNWGISMYAIYLFFMTIWWCYVWEDATACPYTHLEDVIEGKKSLRVAFLLIWAQLMGGLVVFRFNQLLWALEIVPTHKGRAFSDCTTDLQVPVFYGAIIEGVATCICRVVSRILGDLNPRFSTIIDSFVGTSLVVAAANYSGGYFNPALATSLKYGCLGTTVMDHVIVYWVGACAGSIASIRIYKMPFVQRFFQKEKSD